MLRAVHCARGMPASTGRSDCAHDHYCRRLARPGFATRAGSFPTPSAGICSSFPLAGGRGDEIEAQLRREPSTCWFSEVNDGLERIGFLQLVLPDDARQDRSFNSVGDLAEAFAQLISRSASAARLAESRTDEVATLVDIGRSIPTERNLVDALQRLLDGATQLTAFRSCAFFSARSLDRAAQAASLFASRRAAVRRTGAQPERKSPRPAGPVPGPCRFRRRRSQSGCRLAASRDFDGRLPGCRIRGGPDRHVVGLRSSPPRTDRPRNARAGIDHGAGGDPARAGRAVARKRGPAPAAARFATGLASASRCTSPPRWRPGRASKRPSDPPAASRSAATCAS